MSDAHNLYEQHDDLQDRASALRTQFNADAEEFGGWDAEEDEIDGRLNGVEEDLKRLHDCINEVEQLEIDRSNSEEQQKDDSSEQINDLTEKAQSQIAELDKGISILEKDIDDWRESNTPEGDD